MTRIFSCTHIWEMSSKKITSICEHRCKYRVNTLHNDMLIKMKQLQIKKQTGIIVTMENEGNSIMKLDSEIPYKNQVTVYEKLYPFGASLKITIHRLKCPLSDTIGKESYPTAGDELLVSFLTPGMFDLIPGLK